MLNEEATPSDTVAQTGQTIVIAERLLTALDRETAARNFADRNALVDAILTDWVRRAEESAAQAIYTRPVLTKELSGDDSGGEQGIVYELGLQEIAIATKPRKQVHIRRQVRGFGGEYMDKRTITFPIGGAAWVRETLLPWLAEGLKEAETAHQTEVAESRRRAQARRAARTAEEKAEEIETRCHYTQRYGKRGWEYAVSQASRHRARAERHGLTEHFTTAQWLDRAAESSFKCSMCGTDALLETHHSRALSAGGGNTMANVQLLCGLCHHKVEQRGEDGGDAWYARELEKMALFHVGDQVRRVYGYGVRATERGVVQEVLPPKRGDAPLWCHRAPLSARDGMGGKLIVPREPLRSEHIQSGYQPIRVRVFWTRKKGGKTYEETVPAKELEICSPSGSHTS